MNQLNFSNLLSWPIITLIWSKWRFNNYIIVHLNYCLFPSNVTQLHPTVNWPIEWTINQSNTEIKLWNNFKYNQLEFEVDYQLNKKNIQYNQWFNIRAKIIFSKSICMFINCLVSCRSWNYTFYWAIMFIIYT